MVIRRPMNKTAKVTSISRMGKCNEKVLFRPVFILEEICMQSAR